MFCKLGIISIVCVLKCDANRHAVARKCSTFVIVRTGCNAAELGGRGE